MKILFLSSVLSYGGASKLIYDLLPRMNEKGHSCSLLILKDDHTKYIDELRNKGVSVEFLPKQVKSHIGIICYIKNYIRDEQFDIVHANLFPTIYYTSFAKKLSGKSFPKLVMTEHNTDNRRRHMSFLRFLENLVYAEYDHIISISEQTQVKLLTWLRKKKSDRYCVIDNGIDVEKYKNEIGLNKKELFPDCNEATIFLLTVGRFTTQKNHKMLIEALSKLPQNYILLLAGEGPLQDEIKDQVIEMNLENRVVFLGFRSDIARVMHAADIMVIPSLWEGFGLIAAEGMACGLAIAASDVPGLSEIVGDCAVKFNPKDSLSISAAIKRLGDVQLREHYAEKGTNRAYNYDIQNMVKRYLYVYSKLVQER